MSNNQDAYYLSLLGLAETFRTENPPQIRNALHCLKAILTCNPPPKVAARTHLQIATLLLKHANNRQMAKDHLQEAWNLSQSIANFDEVRFVSAHKLVTLLVEDSERTLGSGPPGVPNDGSIAHLNSAKAILMRALELSPPNPYWHTRLMLQDAKVSLRSKEHSSAIEILQNGFDYANMHNMGYIRSLFYFTKAMVMMMDPENSVPLSEVQQLLNNGIEALDGCNATSSQKDHLRVFGLVLVVTNQLNMGQVKSAKPALKQLQHSIQTASQSNHIDNESFKSNCDELYWLSRSELCVLVYLVSVRQSIHAGYMDKAHKYTEKALSQILKVGGISVGDSGWLEVLLIEHTALCHLVMGNKLAALTAITKLTQLLREHPNVAHSHLAQVHTLLAIYAMSVNCMEAAEQQFNAALRTSQNRELWTFANLNLGLVYLKSDREADFLALQERLHPDSIGTSSSHSLRAAAYYVQGMHSFMASDHDDAKRHLREALKMANAEDLNRLTSCSLVVLGHVFNCSGAPKEAANMANPAMQLASKIPDLHLQLWSASLLKDIHTQFGEAPKVEEYEKKYSDFTSKLTTDHSEALQKPQHTTLINWTSGPLPVCEPIV